MGILTDFGMSIDDLVLYARASAAAYSGSGGGLNGRANDLLKAGWQVIKPVDLGLPSKNQDGNFYTEAAIIGDGANALVLRKGSEFIVSFRGTEYGDETDWGDFIDFVPWKFESYIDNFDPLLTALASLAPPGATFSFTGHSLGGGAVNQLAVITSRGAYGGRFESATFAAFSAPAIANAQQVLNFGFQNDPVFRLLVDYDHNPSSSDNMSIVSLEYLTGNPQPRWFPTLPAIKDAYAHDIEGYISAVERLRKSHYLNLMNFDSLVLFGALRSDDNEIKGVFASHELTDSFLIGRDNVADFMFGRGGDDHLEGFAGNDFLRGNAGNDVINGGSGASDTAAYKWASDQYVVRRNGNTVTVAGKSAQILVSDGSDKLIDVERIKFSDRTIFVADLPDLSAGTMPGGSASDGNATGGGSSGVESETTAAIAGETIAGNDTSEHLRGGSGPDVLRGNGGDDILTGYAGKDAFDGGPGSDTADYSYNPASVSGIVNLGAGTAAFAGFYTETLASIENIWMGAGNDSITGDAGPNDLRGGPGNDTLIGGAGNDVIYGDWKYSDQGGNDTAILSYTFGGDYAVSGTLAALHIVGSEGDDWYYNIENFKFADGVIKTAAELHKDYIFSGKQTIENISRGTDSHRNSSSPSISSDGRFVAFTSQDSHLVAGDTNEASDVFVYDRLNDTVEAVSVSTDGTPVGGFTRGVSMSDDGHYVVFESTSPNLESPSGISKPLAFRRPG